MTTTGLFHFDSSDYEATAIQNAISMADGLARTITIARLLVENGRIVDMTGLDRGIGLLCAKALDLPPEAGRNLRPTLMMVLGEANTLTEALRNQTA
jgi:hypothetical protein